MQPIHRFLADNVVFADDRRTLDSLDPKTRAALLAMVAGYLPYYTSEAQVGSLVVLVLPFCTPSGPRVRSLSPPRLQMLLGFEPWHSW